MGLDCTHDCYHGSYSGFHKFRHAIGRAIGIDLEKMDGYAEGGTPISWDTLAGDPIVALLNHSDCEGQIRRRDCLPLAKRLEEIAPLLPDDQPAPPWSTYRTVALDFARGLRLADSRKESVGFH